MAGAASPAETCEWAAKNIHTALKEVRTKSMGRQSAGDAEFLQSIGVALVWKGVPRGGKAALTRAYGGNKDYWNKCIDLAGEHRGHERHTAHNLDRTARRSYPTDHSKFVQDYWAEYTRPSPYQRLRDPSDIKNVAADHAIHWVDCTCVMPSPPPSVSSMLLRSQCLHLCSPMLMCTPGTRKCSTT